MTALAGIDPNAAKRAQRTARATEQVRIWANAMAQERQGACLFSMQLPLVDEAALFIGRVDELLRERGYAIVSHSSCPIDNQNGTYLLVHTFLVRAIGEAPRVMLG